MTKKSPSDIVDLDNAIAVVNVNYVDSLEGAAVEKWNRFVRAWNDLKKELETQN